MAAVRVVERDGEALRDAAAQIWAEAVTRRDGSDPDASPITAVRPRIDAVLDGAGRGALLSALDPAGRTVGFVALSMPVGQTAELGYLGVRPDAWGRGVASALLASVRSSLERAGVAQALLSVHVDNAAAVTSYVRAGWVPDGEPVPHERTGRPVQRYRLSLT